MYHKWQHAVHICRLFEGMDANELAKAMQDGGEEGVESFEKLFSQLQIMKGIVNPNILATS